MWRWGRGCATATDGGGQTATRGKQARGVTARVGQHTGAGPTGERMTEPHADTRRHAQAHTQGREAEGTTRSTQHADRHPAPPPARERGDAWGLLHRVYGRAARGGGRPGAGGWRARRARTRSDKAQGDTPLMSGQSKRWNVETRRPRRREALVLRRAGCGVGPCHGGWRQAHQQTLICRQGAVQSRHTRPPSPGFRRPQLSFRRRRCCVHSGHQCRRIQRRGVGVHSCIWEQVGKVPVFGGA